MRDVFRLADAERKLTTQLCVRVLEPVHFEETPGLPAYPRSLVMDRSEAIRERMQRTLDDMLLRVADIYDQEVQRSLQRMLSLLAPAITIVLGVVIAVIIGSMVAAILSAYDLPI